MMTRAGDEYVSRIRGATEFVRSRWGRTPAYGLVLGSGLGDFADRIAEQVIIPYGVIPGFPVSSVQGHAGRLVCGLVRGVPVVAMQGRFHQYEGHSGPTVAIGVRMMAFLGATRLVVSNAAGGINPAYKPGSLVAHSNIIGFFSEHPSTGVWHPDLGELFYDVSHPYCSKFRQRAKQEFERCGVPYHEGVYLMTRGPAYETASEIVAAKMMGADLVGMSTVPEVLAARQLKVDVLGISLVSNLAAGISPTPLHHNEVLEIGKQAAVKFCDIVEGVIAGDA